EEGEEAVVGDQSRQVSSAVIPELLDHCQREPGPRMLALEGIELAYQALRAHVRRGPVARIWSAVTLPRPAPAPAPRRPLPLWVARPPPPHCPRPGAPRRPGSHGMPGSSVPRPSWDPPGPSARLRPSLRRPCRPRCPSCPPPWLR